MGWFDIDGARDYLTREGGKRPSRKQIYKMVRDGLRVSQHSRRLWFCEVWIDEFMGAKGKTAGDIRIVRREVS